MFDKLTKKSAHKKKKPAKVVEAVSDKERLYMTWHRVLIGYALINVVFIIVSVVIISQIQFSQDDTKIDAPVINTVSAETFSQATEIQRVKSLLRSGILSIPELDFDN